MRAICGAIITAGAMIGLGLTALGYGVRYQNYPSNLVHPDSNQLYGAPSMMLIMVVLVIGLIVGLGTAFIGLAFHHERRQREMHRDAHLHSSTAGMAR